jgi:predicted anti-sigma-YlaC factor YlaD
LPLKAVGLQNCGEVGLVFYKLVVKGRIIMHREIEDGLEDFLAGTADPNGRGRVETHLRECTECRQEVDAMRELSELFTSLRSPDPPVPGPDFYARVSVRIDQQRPVPFWTAALDPFFGRRLALASLLVLATLGAVLVSRESGTLSVGPTPEMILAVEQDAPPVESSPLLDRDQMLATLVSHRQ